MVILAVANVPLFCLAVWLAFDDHGLRGFAAVLLVTAGFGLPWFLLQRQLNVFPAVVPFAALEEGAIAVLVGRVERRTRDWPLPVSSLVFPQAGVPRDRLKLRVTRAENREPPALGGHRVS